MPRPPSLHPATRPRGRRAGLVIAATLATGAVPAAADIFCVATSAQFEGALIAAGLNGEDDQIRIRSGIYPAPMVNGFRYAPVPGGSDESSHLAISGGWSGSACTRYGSLAHATVLQGAFGPVLRLVAQGGGKYEISNLTITQGASGPGVGALDVRSDANQGPLVALERVRFVGNEGFAALQIETDKSIQVIGSLFADNLLTVGGGGSAIVRRTGTVGNAAIFILNTVTANAATHSGFFTGLRFENWGTDETVIVDNVFWGNQGGDVLLFGPIEPFSFNDFGVVDGVWIGTANLSVDPEFVSPPAGDYRLRSGSPMIDSGVNTGLIYPPEWDLLGQARPLSSYDRGAYEYHPPLFADGFESGDVSAWNTVSP
jgi:hypothetical protein